MGQNMLYLGIHSTGNWKKKVYHLVLHSIKVNQIILVDGIKFFYILLISSNFSINCWERSVEVSTYSCGFVYFSFKFYLYFMYFASLLFGANMYDCYIFLVGQPFYHYVMFLALSVNFLCPEVILCDENIATNCFPLIYASMTYLFAFFYF